MRFDSADDDVDVQPISDHEWRVRDTRLPEHDALCVIGVIENTSPNRFDALLIGAGGRTVTASTLQDAVDALIDARTEHENPESTPDTL